MYGFHAVLPRHRRTREKIINLEAKLKLFSKIVQLNGKLEYIRTGDVIHLVSPFSVAGPFKPTEKDKLDPDGYYWRTDKITKRRYQIKEG